MKNAVIYKDGQFFKGDKITLSISDLALIRGYGVHEFIRAYDNVPFHLDMHLHRLEKSAKRLLIGLPYSLDQIKAIISELINIVPFTEIAIKLLITGGESHDFFSPDGKPIFIAIAFPLPVNRIEHYTDGIKLLTKSYIRPYPEAKGTNYLSAIMGSLEAKKMSAHGVLFIDSTGNLLECGRENFFAIRKKTLITPKNGILKGITREIVLKISKQLCFLEERAVHKNEIPTFDGAFVTSTQKEIMPVGAIDNIRFIKGAANPLILKFISQFSTYVNQYVKARKPELKNKELFPVK